MSGEEVVSALRRFGFEVVSVRGSHAKLRRTGVDGDRETLNIPLHRSLDTGTTQALFRQAAQFIDENELRPYFYSE